MQICLCRCACNLRYLSRGLDGLFALPVNLPSLCCACCIMQNYCAGLKPSASGYKQSHHMGGGRAGLCGRSLSSQGMTAGRSCLLCSSSPHSVTSSRYAIAAASYGKACCQLRHCMATGWPKVWVAYVCISFWLITQWKSKCTRQFSKTKEAHKACPPCLARLPCAF